MNPRLAQALVRLYPRAWRERYGAEFAELLEEAPGGMGAVLDVVVSALRERAVPTMGGERMATGSRLSKWSVRAPWAVYAVAPVGLLVSTYVIALFLLWSGWRMFLPAEKAPFVPVTGWAIVYFGAGRALYFCGPMLVGCAIAWLAARVRAKAIWPLVGMLLIAWIGGVVQVRVSRPTLNESGNVGISLAMGHPGYALCILAVSVLVYWLLRLRRGYSGLA